MDIITSKWPCYLEIPNTQIEQLEKCDRLLMRKVSNCISTTAIEAYYLEANILPFRHIIIARRLMFYWTILNKSESELVRQVLHTQQLSPVKNDWCVQIAADLKMCSIELTESEISKMTKYKFKSLVKRRVTDLAREYLINLKVKHSKSAGLSDSFDKMQDYLSCNDMSTEEKQLLFKFRTRTYPCKTNFRNLYEPDLSCSICLKEDSPEHLLNCTAQGIETSGMDYNDIFGDIKKQVKIIKVLKQITTNRNLIMNKSPTSGSQAHPL